MQALFEAGVSSEQVEGLQTLSFFFSVILIHRLLYGSKLSKLLDFFI
jgi:hypothetical protein